MIRVVREWSQEVPAAWETALRAFSPIREDVPWLALRWFPMQQQDPSGLWHDAGRWVLYECVSEMLVRLGDPETDIFDYLGGTPPSQIEDPATRASRKMFASDYQCAMYQKYRVWARNLWILQGTGGGHPVEYTYQEQQWLKAMDQPLEPPRLGTLCYAPFDERVIAQMRNRNRLMRLGGNMDRLRQSGKTLGAEWDAADREFRKQHLKAVEESTAGQADFLAWYASSAKTSTECRNTLPEMSRAERDAAATFADRYIETGSVS